MDSNIFCVLNLIWITITAPVIVCDSSGSGEFVSHEKKLMTDLLTDYNTAVRPAISAQDTVTVKVHLVLLKILDLDEKHQVLNTQGWLYQSWVDFQLKWDKDEPEYGQLERLRIPTKSVWTPDVVLYNTASETYENVIDKMVVTSYDGTVHWMPHANFKSHCHLDLNRFPFDSQECQLAFGSWTYDLTQLDVQLNTEVSIEYTMEALNWELLEKKTERFVYNVSKTEKYPSAMFTLKFKRKDMFQKTMFVGPAVLLTTLVIFLFLTPPQAGERITLGIGVVIACTIMLLVLDSHLPAEMASTPVIGMYYIFTLIMASIAIIISIGILNFHHRGIRQNSVPHWMKTIFLRNLGRLLCVQGVAYSSLPTEEAIAPQIRLSDQKPPDSPVSNSSTAALEQVLDEIRMYLKQCANKGSETDVSHRQMVIDEWHQVAQVVDRLMFCIYTFLSILVSLAMLH